MQQLERLVSIKSCIPIDGSTQGVVEEEAGIHEAEEPCVGWGTGPVKDDIGGGFDCLDALFKQRVEQRFAHQR